MKRFFVLLLALLLCAGGALAEEVSAEKSASVAVRTALMDMPDDAAQTLMEYVRGTRVEVIREANAQYVQVNMGRPGGSLMGYMKKSDLVFGEAHVRENRPIEVTYLHTDYVLRSYFDAQAEAIALNGNAYFRMLGENGDWMHVSVMDGGREVTGFVNKREMPEWGRLRTSYDSAVQIRTWPTGDEPTPQDAIAYAKERLMADRVECNALDGEIVTMERLERCRAEVEMFYTYDTADASPLCYLVTFFYDDRTWEDGSEMICALACLYVDGDEFIAYDYGKG